MAVHVPRGGIHTGTPIYGYVPTEWIAALFVALFAFSTVLHAAQAVRYRLWWLFPTAVACGITEILGWSARLWSAKNPTLLTPYLMQISTLALAPTFFVAANFIIFGRLILLLGRQYSRLSPMVYTAIFCCADLSALTVQGVGGGLASAVAAQQKDPVSQGHIMLAGIALQLAFIVIYVTFGAEYFARWSFNRPVRTAPATEKDLSALEGTGTPQSEATAVAMGDDRRLGKSIKLMIAGLAFTTLCIFIRSVYRVIELTNGFTGPIIQTQVYFNVLDATMLVLSMYCLNVLHPGVLLKKTRAHEKYATK